MSALAFAASALSALAQTAMTPVPAPSAAASTPGTSRPAPRLQTPTELREGSSTPGDLRPEGKVTPQIVVPLRRATPPPTKAERAATRPVSAVSSPVIDDSAARCEAQVSKAARDQCGARDKKKMPAQSR
ncbi:MAG: hypothetical protein V4792_14445 [Pseudomonadota bacterium]